MGCGFENAIAFGTLLSKNEAANKIYDSYTADQKRAILLQLAELDPEEISDLVNNL